jgi:periplasmic divalent cation tolerance protein
MTDSDAVVTVITSLGTEQQAIEVAERLVGDHLATCVNIVPCTRTIYRWHNDRICDDTELLLIIKTTKAREQEVLEAAARINNYEIPEVMGTGAVADDATGAWIAAMTADPESHPR